MSPPEPHSPCIGICRLNPQEVCVGCGRHIEEIIDWFGADAARKAAIAEAARARLTIIARSPATALPDDPAKTK